MASKKPDPKTSAPKKAASPASVKKSPAIKGPGRESAAAKQPAGRAVAARKAAANDGATAKKAAAKKIAPGKPAPGAKKAPVKGPMTAEAKPAKAEKTGKGDTTEKPAKAERAAKPENADKAGKTEKAPVVREPRGRNGSRAGQADRIPAREDAPAPPRPGKATSRYNVGDKVVHPQHGAATIARRVKREFAGETRDYYVLDISTESLTVMVPVEKVDSVVRSVISKTQSRNVLASLKEEPQEAGANWSRWYKVLTEKMYSGDIFQVAEVVRDLSFAQQTKGISPALKRMLSKARMTLISELSFSLEEDEEEATKRLDKALPKIETALTSTE
jgi:CarD family transcriptional regulator